MFITKFLTLQSTVEEGALASDIAIEKATWLKCLLWSIWQASLRAKSIPKEATVLTSVY